MGVLPDLQPVLIRQGDDEAEVISVLITVDNMSIRLITAYGRQEVDRDQDGHKGVFRKRNKRGRGNGARFLSRI